MYLIVYFVGIDRLEDRIVLEYLFHAISSAFVKVKSVKKLSNILKFISLTTLLEKIEGIFKLNQDFLFIPQGHGNPLWKILTALLSYTRWRYSLVIYQRTSFRDRVHT